MKYILYMKLLVIAAAIVFGVCPAVQSAEADTDTAVEQAGGDDSAADTEGCSRDAENDSVEKDIDEKTQLAYIPELSWRTEDYQGRELTYEVAEQYPRGNFVGRTVDNTVWGVGEHLVFSVDYGFYRAGTATMSVVDTVDVNGGSCYHIKSTAKSNGFISSFYKVRDDVNSYIDVDGLFSRRFEKKLREGKYKSDRFVDFYHDRLIALNTKKKHAVTEIPLYVQDILSSLYYLRTLDLQIGRDEFIKVYADGKVYPLKVIVHKRETVKVDAGKFKCLKVEPVLQSEGLFKQDGKLTVWLTNDEHKMPVKMTSKILIGSIGANLESYTLGDTQ